MDLQFDTNDAVQWWDSDSAPLSPEGSPVTPASDLSDGSLKPQWLSSTKDSSLWTGYPSLGSQGFMETPTLPSNSYLIPGADFLYDLPELANDDVAAGYASLAGSGFGAAEPTIKTEDLLTETISLPELDIEEQQSGSPASSQDDMEAPLPRSRSSTAAKTTRSGSGVKRGRTAETPAASPRSPAKSAKVKREAAAAADSKCRAKTNHNDIERKYRNRLSGQFEMLLAVLNRAAADACADGADRPPQHHSKAEVLAMARGRIRALEKKNLLQMREMERLRREIVRLQVSSMLPMAPMALNPSTQGQ